jgi:hypothetical protein
MAGSLTHRRGKKSLLIRRDATLRISGGLHLGIFDQPAKNEFFNRLSKLKIQMNFLQTHLAFDIIF